MLGFRILSVVIVNIYQPLWKDESWKVERDVHQHRPERQSIQMANMDPGTVIPPRALMIHADASVSLGTSLTVCPLSISS